MWFLVINLMEITDVYFFAQLFTLCVWTFLISVYHFPLYISYWCLCLVSSNWCSFRAGVSLNVHSCIHASQLGIFQVSDLTISSNVLNASSNKPLHGVDPLSYFSFQPVLHDWCNKGRGMCYPVCGMVHIKEPLLSIEKSSSCGGSGFPLSLSEWSFTICLTPYNRK